MKYDLRPIQPQDAQQFLLMMTQLDTETSFMLLEPGERTKDVGKVEAMILRHRNQNDYFMGVWADERIVGMMSAERGSCHRIAHSAYIVIGMLKQYQGMGIGTALFASLDHWASKNKITRLELTVVAKNHAAVHLYQKCGYMIEGTKKQSMMIDGAYEDEYYMGKVFS